MVPPNRSRISSSVMPFVKKRCQEPITDESTGACQGYGLRQQSTRPVTNHRTYISRLLARIKQAVSKHVKQILIENDSSLLTTLTIRERLGKTCFRFWQEGPGFDRNLCHGDAIEAAIEYIHLDPIRYVVACVNEPLTGSGPVLASTSIALSTTHYLS